MGSLLEFRRPQFSEEVAWLPAWLQQHHVDPLDGHVKDDLQETFKGNCPFSFPQNISTAKDVNLSAMDPCRYKSCHLFLSGEDDSPASLAPSSGNVVNFHLYLSPDGTSQNTHRPLLDTSQTWRIASSNLSLAQQTEVPAGQEETENQVRLNTNIDMVNFPPLTSQKVTSDCICTQSLPKDKGFEMKHSENVGYLTVSDIDEAVELSIAASEALIIHDIVKSSASTTSLATADVLEVALRVKQARLQDLEDSFQCLTEDIDETDLLSDMNESDMEDVCEDVGFSVTCPDTSCASTPAISQVEDSQSSENTVCDDSQKHEWDRDPKVDSGDVSSKIRLKDIMDVDKKEGEECPVEVLNCDSQIKLDHPTFCLNTPDLESNNSSGLHWSVSTGSDVEDSIVPATTEGVDFATMNITSFLPQADENCSAQAWKRDDNITIAGHDRFQSRWLGGWTWKKDIEASVLVKHNNDKNIPKLLVGETSYLSESADIVADENSFVMPQDKGSHIASQASIPFDGLQSRDDEGILFSQDVVCSSSLSLVDPLCSVVPCSISSENACSTLPENPNDEIEAGRCIDHASGDRYVNLQRTLSGNAESVHEEHQAVSTANGEAPQSTARRQLTSLRTYSVQPCCSSFLKRNTVNCSRLFPSEYSSVSLCAEQNMSSKRGSTGQPSLKSIHKCSIPREIEKSHQRLVVQNPVSDLINQKKKAARDDAVFQVHMETDECSTLLLKQGRSCSFEFRKEFVHDFTGEENQEQPVLQKTAIELLLSKNLQKEPFKGIVGRGSEVPVRKRVQFSETEIQLLQKQHNQKLQSSYRFRSTSRAGKRLRDANPQFKSKAQQVKKHQTNYLDKPVKRLIFQDIEFLLTGFSSETEKEIESLIRKYGGTVLSDIPSPSLRGKRSSRFKIQQLPMILCSKKLETTKFLYGCAVNAYILDVNWLTDSVAAGTALTPDNYMIMSNHVGNKCTRTGRASRLGNHYYMFYRVGIMLHGMQRFCTGLAKVVKHGGGKVFKTLQWLVQNLDSGKISVGVIVAEDETWASRHLKHCASERKIPMMPASWIINSLHVGKLLPFVGTTHPSSLPKFKILNFQPSSAL